MTLPTVTWGVAWQTDCGDKTDWTEHEDGMSATITVDSGTVFNIAVASAVGNKIVYYEYDLGTSNISSDSYSKFIVRYKTSSTLIKAKVVLVFTSGTQTIMPEASSLTWATFSDSITAGKTIDKIRLYATQNIGNVYFDFVSIFAGTQTFHNYDRLIITPRIKKAITPIPGRDTDVTQMLGRGNTSIMIEGPMRSGKSWGGSNLTYGEFFMRILSEKKFQWFTSDQGNFKVTPAPEGFSFTQDKNSDYQLHYSIQLEECDVGDASVFGSSGWYGK